MPFLWKHPAVQVLVVFVLTDFQLNTDEHGCALAMCVPSCSGLVNLVMYPTVVIGVKSNDRFVHHLSCPRAPLGTCFFAGRL